jgi:L-ascorbate metabolism protein UlaG (beta-lactamase superfamily)
MNITHIRNATQLISYAGKRLLIDPMLAPKGAYPGFPGTAHAERRNPTVELPVDVNTLLDADAVIVTHTHDDHWDRAAAELIAKDKPIYVQNDRDAALLRSQGFSNLTVMTDATFFGDIQITKTQGGQHGARPVAWCCVIPMRRRSILPGIPSGETRWRPICKSTSRTWWC